MYNDFGNSNTSHMIIRRNFNKDSVYCYYSGETECMYCGRFLDNAQDNNDDIEETGYVTVGETSFLQLTAKGKSKANEIYSRHVLLTNFLQKIAGISAEQAEENACRIEHDIDADVKKGIERWMKENS